MTSENDTVQEHDKYKELSALAVAGNLTEAESAELKAHLAECASCRSVYEEHLLVAKEGMAMLGERFDRREPATDWDNSPVRSKVFERIAAGQPKPVVARVTPVGGEKVRRGFFHSPVVKFGLAASVVVAVGLSGYQLGRKEQQPAQKPIDPTADARYVKLASEKEAVDTLLSADELKLRRLDAEFSARQADLERLRSELHASDEHVKEIAAGKDASDQQLQTITQERDAFNKRFADAQQAFQSTQAEMASLKSERDQVTVRSVNLQKQVDSLVAENDDKQRRLGDQQQYLSADRDIRELMGARQLYIADVFDVSSDSRTRKPYGRVFYTKGKSLVFYAFDLEGQPHVTDASTFQVWGKNESAQDRPVKLGILYVDSQVNRRWALRCDDPRQLAEIDSVFVTVEANAKSNKPTGKPFLYASLRKEANHP